MSVDLKDLEATPTLSLDPFGEMEKEAEVPAAPAPEVTTLVSSIFFPTTFSALIMAAIVTTAVPCWSS